MNEVRKARGLLRVADFFFVLRPTLWFPVWTMILAGTQGKFDTKNPGQTLLLVTGLSLLMGVVYLLNQLRDRESDRENKKLFFFDDGYISSMAGWTWASILLLTGLILVVITTSIQLILIVAGLLVVTGALYNLSRYALKNSPFGSLLATIMGGAGLWLLGFELVQPGWQIDSLPLIGYTAAFTATGIMTMVPDLEGDIASGKRTIAVLMGQRLTVFIALIFVAIACLSAIYLKDIILLSATLISMPFFIWSLFSKSILPVFGSIKISILALTVAVGIAHYPLYLAGIVLYFALARLYYRKRFGMHYPSFSFKS